MPKKRKPHAPFIATFSDLLRLVVRPEHLPMLKGLTQDAVDRIAHDPKIASSLKAPAPKGTSLRRQMDIRPDGRSLPALKLFIGWDRTRNCWHVFIEGGVETGLESRIVDPGKN